MMRVAWTSTNTFFKCVNSLRLIQVSEIYFYKETWNIPTFISLLLFPRYYSWVLVLDVGSKYQIGVAVEWEIRHLNEVPRAEMISDFSAG